MLCGIIVGNLGQREEIGRLGHIRDIIRRALVHLHGDLFHGVRRVEIPGDVAVARHSGCKRQRVDAVADGFGGGVISITGESHLICRNLEGHREGVAHRGPQFTLAKGSRNDVASRIIADGISHSGTLVRADSADCDAAPINDVLLGSEVIQRSVDGECDRVALIGVVGNGAAGQGDFRQLGPQTW